MSDVVTGEAVPLELRLAKFPSRTIAIVIDLAVYLVCGLGLFGLISAVIPGVDTAMATALGLVAVILLLVALPTTIETLSRGRSLGKLALGLRVVRDDGGPIRTRHALVRALSGVFADFVITSGVGAVFCSLLNERGKRIGDVLAGTVVVRERIPAPPGIPAVPDELANWATGLELSRLPNDLALSARSYLSRWRQLSPAVREPLGARLADQVAAVVSPPPPPGVPAWAYLAAVLNERGRRESVRLSAQQQGATGFQQSSPDQQGPRTREGDGWAGPGREPSGWAQPGSPDGRVSDEPPGPDVAGPDRRDEDAPTQCPRGDGRDDTASDQQRTTGGFAPPA
ncbi:RDD family protein [Phytoactinopolyspora endophytica]|uniref:RDD family protein n=1 Tax=Phytoactinopolyspora endophytica TaxID=1642495 RepID=UPI00197BF3BF|nr:RDD family protein [Phytoactinopolyspora endophytica]